MAELPTVVVAGASRGLGLASAAHLYHRGWRVIAAMRSVDAGLDRLRERTGASPGDARLAGVALDLTDSSSIERAAKEILDVAGAPDALVHNAGISAAGMVEETPIALWEKMFATNLFGPVELTRALLPAMRAAGRGRIVLVSSEAGVRGMPATAPYSAVKGAVERWGEAMAGEIAPFGLGVTVLIAGTYDTDIITDAGTTDHRDLDGPYARLHRTIDRRGRLLVGRAARPPERFVTGLAAALDDTSPYARRPVGPDARMLVLANAIVPTRGMHHMTRLLLGIPRRGSLRNQPNI